jgi:carbon monoxide dehydrogenase subunit G
MDMTGVQRIDAPREVVWAALNDVEVLRQCIPGCETIEKKSDTEFSAKVTLRVGTLKASFIGKVTLSDLDPPNGYTISGSGSGGAAGFVNGGAKVRLDPDGTATVLTYEVKAALGGKLSIGAKVMDSTAKKLAAEFFAKLSEALAPTPEGQAPAGNEKKAGWFRSLLKTKTA